MKQIKFIAIAIFIAATTTACGGRRNMQSNQRVLEMAEVEPTNRYVPEGWKAFETREFSILYPDNFEFVTSRLPQGMYFELRAPQHNISLGSIDWRRSRWRRSPSLDSVMEYIKQDFEIIESGIIKINNVETFQIIHAKKTELLNLKVLQRSMIKNERFYIWTFTIVEDQFDNYIEVATKIMNSFKIR